MEGIARAWHIRETDEARAAHVEKFGYPDTGLDSWIVNGPYHPFWSWWYIGLISLADVPGVPPANKQYPEAEYELVFWSLEGEPNVDAIERGDLENRGFGFLHPADVTFHFDGVTDKQAVAICRASVQKIVNGQSCDSDFRGWWMESLADTVQHYKQGLHG